MASAGGSSANNFWYAFDKDKLEIEGVASRALSDVCAKSREQLLGVATDACSSCASLRRMAVVLWSFPEGPVPLTKRGNARRLCSAARQFAEHSIMALSLHPDRMSKVAQSGIMNAKALRDITVFANHPPLTRSREELPADKKDSIWTVTATQIREAARLVDVVTSSLLDLAISVSHFHDAASPCVAWSLSAAEADPGLPAALNDLHRTCLKARDAFDRIRTTLGMEKHGVVPSGGAMEQLLMRNRFSRRLVLLLEASEHIVSRSVSVESVEGDISETRVSALCLGIRMFSESITRIIYGQAFCCARYSSSGHRRFFYLCTMLHDAVGWAGHAQVWDIRARHRSAERKHCVAVDSAHIARICPLFCEIVQCCLDQLEFVRMAAQVYADARDVDAERWRAAAFVSLALNISKNDVCKVPGSGSAAAGAINADGGAPLAHSVFTDPTGTLACLAPFRQSVRWQTASEDAQDILQRASDILGEEVYRRIRHKVVDPSTPMTLACWKAVLKELEYVYGQGPTFDHALHAKTIKLLEDVRKLEEPSDRESNDARKRRCYFYLLHELLPHTTWHAVEDAASSGGGSAGTRDAKDSA